MCPDQFLLSMQALEHSGAIDRSVVRGCSEVEISVLEDKYGVRLPQSYRAFLSMMGHDCGGLFDHDHVEVDYRVALDRTEAWRKDTSRKFVLPEDAVVVLDRMGDYHQYIRCNQPFDSPVWGICVWDSEPVQCCGSVLHWLSTWGEEAESSKASIKTLQRRRGFPY